MFASFKPCTLMNLVCFISLFCHEPFISIHLLYLFSIAVLRIKGGWSRSFHFLKCLKTLSFKHLRKFEPFFFKMHSLSVESVLKGHGNPNFNNNLKWQFTIFFHLQTTQAEGEPPDLGLYPAGFLPTLACIWSMFHAMCMCCLKF